MNWSLLSIVVLVAAVAVLGVMAFAPQDGVDGAEASAAKRVALNWTGSEVADPPRWDGDGWEVDVRRPNGSVVEVTLGRSLELLELDEERGPGGSPAEDEVQGPTRARAIAAAREASGPGQVASVELERDGTIEVDVIRPDRTVAEVELDRDLRVTDVDTDDIGDE